MIGTIDALLLALRLLLAGVFVVAGVAKLADRRGSRQALADFGVPARLTASLAIVLPLAELAVATALLPTRSAWWGAIGALLLLLAFAAAIAANFARGRTPDCHCFGQLHSSPAGWSTLARNGALAAAAGFVVAFGADDPGASAFGWVDELSTGEAVAVAGVVALAAVAAAQAAFLLHLGRQNGRLLLRIETLERAAGVMSPDALREPEPEVGLPVGSPAPSFNLSGLHGETLTLEALLSVGRDLMLVFTDPNCVPCNALLPEIGAWQRDHSASLMVVPVSRGTPEENRPKVAEHGLINVLLQENREVDDAYEVDGTPAAVVVRADGTIGSFVAGGADAIRALLGRTIGTAVSEATSPPPPPGPTAPDNAGGNGAAPEAPPAPPLPVGDPAPPVRLRDLKGRTFNLAGMRGTTTLVLFWDPSCGFCSQILDDLKAWEADPPEGAPKLLVVATESVEDNQAMGFRSRVLLDSGFSVGNAFRAPGTPSAVLVDEKGRIASELAVGGPAVLALAGIEVPSLEPAQAAQQVARAGDPAPMFELQEVAGGTVGLADFRGKETVLVFWNPGCGFCQRMAEDLKAWEAERPETAPQLLVVSTGAVDANRAQGLASPVVLDQGFAVGNSFGASGTPMAVLVDAEGNVASEVVGGAQAVLSLARGERDQQAATA